MTFLISEDEALRDRLKGMVVADDKSSDRAVGVWFGQPDLEIRAQSYPYVTVDLIDVSEANERVMNAVGVSPWYYDVQMTVDGVTYDDWDMPMPIPVNLDYQVTTFARQPRHDRQIMHQIMGNRLPFRFGSLLVKEQQDEDGNWDATTRRLDMLGMAKRDTVEAGKRLFMNVFTVRVSSELPSPYVERLYKRVQTVITEYGGFEPSRPITSTPTFKETITISAPVGTP